MMRPLRARADATRAQADAMRAQADAMRAQKGSRARAARASSLAIEPSKASLQRGLALGFLSMLPLFCAYEAAVAFGGSRNVAEIGLTLPFALAFGHVAAIRRAMLGAAAVFALWSSFHGALGLAPRLWRIVFEGVLGAVLLGPALLVLFASLGGAGTTAALHSAPLFSVPGLDRAGLYFGGAAYEEIVFRVGLQSLAFLLAYRSIEFFSASSRFARRVAELLALFAAALVFAAAHLAVFTRLIGTGGEIFDLSIFTWRTLAGILLGALFRWRGPGVAAWTHGLFNLAVYIGAGPDVFL